ncbi:MAG TPA: MarR family winged helix-turn-helix transcriptional regulator [Candidatus Saccharimonadales bacterium]|nr:MarR family winged helix-turn-helix transcriptional regulator [Candidatus Saccharimonadales bacterium]
MKAQAFSHKDSPTSLHQLMFVLQQLTNELLESEVKIGLSQVRIMSALHTSIAYSQHGVAIKLRQTEANISRQLQSMKRQGLVDIKRNPKDKRQREVILTSKGKNTYDKSLQLLNIQQKDLLRLLSSEETKAFNHAIDNLLKAIG